jgi:hypothetical protein
MVPRWPSRAAARRRPLEGERGRARATPQAPIRAPDGSVSPSECGGVTAVCLCGRPFVFAPGEPWPRGLPVAAHKSQGFDPPTCQISAHMRCHGSAPLNRWSLPKIFSRPLASKIKDYGATLHLCKNNDLLGHKSRPKRVTMSLRVTGAALIMRALGLIGPQREPRHSHGQVSRLQHGRAFAALGRTVASFLLLQHVRDERDTIVHLFRVRTPLRSCSLSTAECL